jgi:beta-galactosidase
VGEVTPVHVFTSGDEAELFVNGKSQGRRKKGEYEYRLRWDEVNYEPGELTVVAYKAGKKWATSSVKTADAPAKLEMMSDRSRIRANGTDLAFVTLRITDQHGTTAPRANNRIKFSIEGPGEIVATDNGDPTSFESFQSPEREAFNGYALAIVRGEAGQPGKITVRASSSGLQETSIVVRSVRDPR